MASMLKSLAISVIALGALGAGSAQATEFTVTKNVSAETFTLTDTNPSVGVTELLVEELGYGVGAGTTQPGWSAGQILFGSDPLGCGADTGSTITVGFCYKLTTPGAAPITALSTTFTFDSAGDDQTLPSQFALLFQTPSGQVEGCTGNTGPGGGCSVTAVPEPPARSLMLAGLAILTVIGIGRVRSI